MEKQHLTVRTAREHVQRPRGEVPPEAGDAVMPVHKGNCNTRALKVGVLFETEEGAGRRPG